MPGDSIEFSSGKKFSFNNSKNVIELIEQSKTIKLANDIQNCTFTKRIDNGKTIIKVEIIPEGLNMQTINFVLNSQSFAYENEEDYVQKVQATYAKEEDLNLGANVRLVAYEDLENLNKDGDENANIANYGTNLKAAVDSGKVKAVIEETVGEGNNAVTYTAVVPVGYTVSSTENENAITKGLVIYDGTSSNRNNEFVWIPVPNNDMKVATTSDQYNGFTAYAEPKELIGKDSRTGSTNEERLQYDSQEELDYYYGKDYFTYPDDVSDEANVTDFSYGVHYKEMAQGVNKYGGFYIGRYETTIDSSNNIGSKYNTEVLTSDKIIKEGKNNNANTGSTYIYRWWGLYYAQRHANVTENGNKVQTNMIWGQQWDKMLVFLDSQNISYAAIDTTNTYNRPSSVLASGQATYTNKTENPEIEDIKDEIFNIYDLRMNTYEWTAEAFTSYNRCYRGGIYNSSISADTRDFISPNSNNKRRYSSLTLYKVVFSENSYGFIRMKYKFNVMKFA